MKTLTPLASLVLNIRNLLWRFWKLTVWGPGGVRAEDWRFRGIFRFVLPATDLIFMYFGIVGWWNGVGSVEDAAGSTWQAWWSLAIALSALGAFVGVGFPKLWLLELCAKLFLIGLVSAYVLLFLARGLSDPLITATAGLIVILILLPVWRVGDLGFVAWTRGVSFAAKIGAFLRMWQRALQGKKR